MLGSIGFTWFLSTCSIHNTSKLGCKDIIHQAYNVVKSMDKLFDELFIHPFIGGGHRDEQNNNEQK